ncbi:unnamed protein product [Brassica rapa subsp. narinosa]
MKIYHRSSLIGLIMLTILLLGTVVTNAQKGRPVRKKCVEQYPDPNGKCVFDQCKAQYTKNRKGGLARCIDSGKGHMQCRCDYHC